MSTLKKILTSAILKNILFWICLFFYYILTADWADYSSMSEVFSVYLFKEGLQILTYFSILFIIKQFLNKEQFILAIIVFLAIMYTYFLMYILYSMYYLEIQFPESYVEFFQNCPDSSFYGRISNFQTFISKSVFFLYPGSMLVALIYYKGQQRLLKINQEKKTGELKALKNQLNPHFLFNTLNNLYTLSLKKSDKAPEVISKLSDILDYMLYRCDETFVSIHKEIELIQNYLALEKIRYGDRVDISFTHTIDNGAKIAPLLLLTFIENAFKHGVVQELNKAKINIDIAAKDNQIKIVVMNTKPKGFVENATEKSKIGLSNVKQQLALIYQNEFDLKIDDTLDAYTIELILPYK
jgi:sensor histidine kinase YesM